MNGWPADGHLVDGYMPDGYMPEAGESTPPVTTPAGALFQSRHGRGPAALRTRRANQALLQYRFLVAEPENLGTIAVEEQTTGIALPANARLAFSHSAGLNAGDVTVEIGNRSSFSHAALPANRVWKGSFAERGMHVVINRHSGAAGTFTLYILDLNGRHFTIATATFE